MMDESSRAANDGIARIDALLPAEIAKRCEEAGVVKAGMPLERMFALAVLAGAFIALGATGYMVLAGRGSASDVSLLIRSIIFSTGLILVICSGAELFTGNNLIAMAWASRRVPLPALLRNWAVVYAGNWVGSIGTAVLVALAGAEPVAVGIALRKTEHAFLEAVCLGILCNALVCLAVWMSIGARTLAGKVAVIVPPITLFVVCGFEHCVANMFIFALALLDPTTPWGEDKQRLLTDGLTTNLVPVTLGNVIGGSVLVALVYWFVYAREPHATTASPSKSKEPLR